MPLQYFDFSFHLSECKSMAVGSFQITIAKEHAVITPRISSPYIYSPLTKIILTEWHYISHLQNINFYLVYIIIINRSETRNMYKSSWLIFPLYILFLLWQWQGLVLTLFGTLSQMSAITYICPTWFESTYIGPCLQFFGRNPGWSPMTDIQVFFAPWLWLGWIWWK